jgi:hypothetical protein
LSTLSPLLALSLYLSDLCLQTRDATVIGFYLSVQLRNLPFEIDAAVRTNGPPFP